MKNLGVGDGIVKKIRALEKRIRHLEISTVRPLSEASSPSQVVMTGANQTVTTEQDLAGCTMTFDTIHPGAVFSFTANVDLRVTQPAATPGLTSMSVYLNVDGVNEARQMVLAEDLPVNNDVRATLSRTWHITFASAGAHTVKLRAARTTGTATCEVLTTHTDLARLIVFGSR